MLRGREGRIRRLQLDPPLYRWTNGSYDEAFERVEEVYEPAYARDRLVGGLVRLFGSQDVHLALKKALLERLAEFFYYRLLIGRVTEALAGAGRVLIVLSRASQVSRQRGLARLLFPGNQPGEVNARWGFPIWLRFLGAAAALNDRCRVALKLARVLRSCVAGVVRRPLVGAAGAYDIGVAVVSPLRELHEGLRAAGSLADGAIIQREQVLLVPVVRLKPEELAWLRGRGLVVADPSLPMSWETCRRVLGAIGRVGRYLPVRPSWLLVTAVGLVHNFGFWHTFIEHYRIGKLVTYADHTINHIPRNIILKQGGGRVWHYSDGQNTGEAMPPLDGRPVRSDLWGYLYYDVMVCWDESFIEYFKRHRQEVGRYVAVGCLWSEHVRLIREGVLPSTFPQALREHGWRPGLRVVSVFPTWYHVESMTSPEDGLAFVRGLEKLMGELRDVLVVLKEKHRRWHYANNPLWGGEEVLAIYQAYEELERQPGWWLPGHEADTAAIVAASDLVISFPFTSVTVEAVGAGVKGLYYDPLGKYRGGAYDRIPGLVAHGYDELKRRVEELLYETTPEEYRAYLETHFKGEKDPYLDARALTRFRELLAGHGD